jgi:hypothetical protein
VSTAPVYIGMPPGEREFRTEFGSIICGGRCRDDYARIEIYHQVPGQRWVRLQRPALDSFREAENKLGFAIFLTGSSRTCELQTALYMGDQNRFAHPDKTAHCRGLAIDVSTSMSQAKQTAIRRALKNRGWHQSRPDDEPWHHSFGLAV